MYIVTCVYSVYNHTQDSPRIKQCWSLGLSQHISFFHVLLDFLLCASYSEYSLSQSTILPIFLSLKWVQYLPTPFPTLSFFLSPSFPVISPLNSTLLELSSWKTSMISCKLREVLFIPKDFKINKLTVSS